MLQGLLGAVLLVRRVAAGRQAGCLEILRARFESCTHWTRDGLENQKEAGIGPFQKNRVVSQAVGCRKLCFEGPQFTSTLDLFSISIVTQKQPQLVEQLHQRWLATSYFLAQDFSRTKFQ